MTSVLWLRRDLRRRDHPALLAARDAAGDGDLLVLFVVDPRLWEGGGAVRRAWLAATLEATDDSFDGALTLLHGDPRRVVPELAGRVGARSVHVSRETTPVGRRRDDVVAARLAEAGVDWVETGTPYAVGPGLVVNGTGEPYKVFTPFSKAWRAHGWPAPAPTPRTLPLRRLRNDADATAAVRAALAAPDLPGLPPAGEEAALARWRAFRDGALPAYADDRNRPDVDGTSRLSPYLKLGVLHPRTLLADLAGQRGKGVTTYENELAWREFYADVLWHTPRSAWQDLRPELAGMRTTSRRTPSRHGRPAARGTRSSMPGCASCSGQGWMHSRLRMVTASFLTKDLHVWWGVGARHFLEHLVDGDIASNNHGWQWVAGTGTDASPYFRVFNPVTQGLRFDPDGDYVRRWVPELAHLPGPSAHEGRPGRHRRLRPGLPRAHRRPRRGAARGPRPARGHQADQALSVAPTFSPHPGTLTPAPFRFRGDGEPSRTEYAGSGMPGRRPVFLDRADGVHSRPGCAARHPGLGELLDHAMASLVGVHADREHGGVAQRARRGDPEGHLRPRARRPGRLHGAGRRAPHGTDPARPGGRGRRVATLGRADPDPARVLRPRLVRLRGLPRCQRQHARPRGVPRDGNRHGMPSGTVAVLPSPTGSSTPRPATAAG